MICWIGEDSDRQMHMSIFSLITMFHFALSLSLSPYLCVCMCVCVCVSPHIDLSAKTMQSSMYISHIMYIEPTNTIVAMIC